MNKFFAGLTVAFIAALMSLGFSGAAHAADDDCGNYTERTSCDEAPNQVKPNTVSDTEAADEQSASGLLPNTGGPEGALLIGGAALLAVGGAAVVVARRRQTTR